MARVESIDITKADCKVNAFHFFYGAAKSILLPFLSIYLRYLGLTALQTGIVIACQAWTYMFFGPFWTRCAFGFNKRKFVLAFSILALMSSFLLMTIIPSINPNSAMACDKHENGTLHPLMNHSDLNAAVKSTKMPEVKIPETTVPTTASGKLSKDIIMNYFSQLTQLEKDTLRKYGITPDTVANMSAEEIAETLNTLESRVASIVHAPPPSTAHPTTKSTSKPTTTMPDVVTDQDTVTYDYQYESDLDTSDPAMEYFNNQKPELIQYLRTHHGLTAEYFRGLTVRQTSHYIKQLIKEDMQAAQEDRRQRRDVKETPEHTTKAGVDKSSEDVNRTFDAAETISEDDVFVKTMDTLTTKLRAFSTRLVLLKEQVFLAVMVLVVFGGIFSAPSERIADSMWFEFLDGMDRLEMFGRHRVAGTVGVLIFPVVITAVVDNTPCLLPFHMHHILLHFYSFTLLAAVAFILAFFFPIYAGSKKIIRSARLCKGLRTLCSGKHAAMFAISAVITGMMQGLLTTFLFWRVQDQGGSEIYMGGAVALAAAGELFIRLIQKWLIRRLSNAGTVVLGLFVLGVRLVVYSFMWAPYVVLAGEAFHAFSHSLIMVAVETYQDFRLNPLAMDRSASAALSFLYQGFGVGVGAATAGAIYDIVGPATLFQGACVLTVTWAILFALMQRCCRRPTKVRYTKLLQEEDNDSSDSEVAYEDDWLEVAMKHQQ